MKETRTIVSVMERTMAPREVERLEDEYRRNERCIVTLQRSISEYRKENERIRARIMRVTQPCLPFPMREVA